MRGEELKELNRSWFHTQGYRRRTCARLGLKPVCTTDKLTKVAVALLWERKSMSVRFRGREAHIHGHTTRYSVSSRAVSSKPGACRTLLVLFRYPTLDDSRLSLRVVHLLYHHQRHNHHHSGFVLGSGYGLCLMGGWWRPDRLCDGQERNNLVSTGLVPIIANGHPSRFIVFSFWDTPTFYTHHLKINIHKSKTS